VSARPETALGSEPPPARPDAAAPALSVVAVASGDGLVRVFEGFGVERIVRGGQSSNPSTGELLKAIRETAANDVLVLPNNPNVKLAAEQAATMAGGKRVVVVATRNAPEGFAALLALDPTLDALANREPMLRAARAVQTLQVTQAARDAKIGGQKVKKGQAIALGPDDGLLAVHKDRLEATVTAVGRFEPGFELLTLYYGEGADLDEAQRLARRLSDAFPSVEVDVEHGGQPHYSYLISAE
jgi:dihydroxyacetone kinase-like predicted kinase